MISVLLRKKIGRIEILKPLLKAGKIIIVIFAVQRLEGKFNKKSGEWFQLSCANHDFSDIQLGELVTKNKPTYAYDGDVGTMHLVTDALIPFWRIKSSTKKRISKPN